MVKKRPLKLNLKVSKKANYKYALKRLNRTSLFLKRLGYINKDKLFYIAPTVLRFFNHFNKRVVFSSFFNFNLVPFYSFFFIKTNSFIKISFNNDNYISNNSVQDSKFYYPLKYSKNNLPNSTTNMFKTDITLNSNKDFTEDNVFQITSVRYNNKVVVDSTIPTSLKGKQYLFTNLKLKPIVNYLMLYNYMNIFLNNR